MSFGAPRGRTVPRLAVSISDDPGAGTAWRLIADEVARALRLRTADVVIDHLCPSCGSSRHGRPLVRPVPGRTVPWISISRADGLTVVALCTVGPVGVDVERTGAARFPTFGRVALHPAERADGAREQTVTWVRKESLLKATGSGLRGDPGLIRLKDPATTPPVLVEWSGPHAATGPVQMYDLALDPDHVAAVSVLARVRPEPRVSGRGPGDPEGRSRTATARTRR